MERIQFVDTHTAGEPTRVVLDSPVPLTATTMAERRQEFAIRCDEYRRAIVCEPRGSDVLVGALLTPPVSAESIAGVIFFNNVGTLGMCGHGTIGVAAALHYLGRISTGTFQLDTPVGPVKFSMQADGSVRVTNVPSYRLAENVPLRLDEHQIVHGDVAWGGNWFYICHDHGQELELAQVESLTSFCRRVRLALKEQEIRGESSAEIDHIELVGPADDPQLADAKNFVLCPGGVYDRSPCGTGTSAKIACLAASGKLSAGENFRQQGIVGGIFEGSYRCLPDQRIEPTICGSASVIAAGELLLDAADPFCMGIEK